MSGTLGGPSSTFRGGTLYFKANGQQYDLGGSFSVQMGGRVREAKAGPNGVLGYITKYVPPMFDCELMDGDAVLLATIKGLTETTFTAELDNGKTYVLVRGWNEGDPELDAVEAKVKAKFSGLSCQELSS
jgi:hypothetical protein